MSDVRKWIDDKTILKCYGGSHAYGLNTPQSDVDIRGICIPPVEYYFGLNNFEQYIENTPDDVTIYSIKKYFQLASKCNPNILEMLYIREEETLKKTALGARIVQERDAFLSTRAVHTYCGYAYAQLKRMKHHKQWLDNPITEKPNRDDYHADPQHCPGGFMAEKYDLDKRKYKQYQTWLKERNSVRAEFEAKHGYDTKHAMHLVRLLKMGHEIVKFGEVNTYRSKDRDELLGIRNGSLSFDEIVAYADDLEQKVRDAEKNSCLPRKPNMKLIEKLLIELTRDTLRG
jgi:uncharacterized protein